MALLYGFIPTKTSHTYGMRILCPTFLGNLNNTFMESYGMYAFAVWRLQSSLSIHCLNLGAHPSPLMILSSNYYVQYISNGYMLQQHYKSFHKPHIGPIPAFRPLYPLPLCYQGIFPSHLLFVLHYTPKFISTLNGFFKVSIRHLHLLGSYGIIGISLPGY